MSKKIEREKIYEILKAKKLITEKQIQDVEQNRLSSHKNIDELVVELGVLREDKFLIAIADYMHVEFVKIDPLKTDLDSVTDSLPGKFVQAYGMMPIKRNGDLLTIAISNPFIDYPFYDIEKMTGLKTEIVLSTKQNIRTAINVSYGLSDSLSAAERDLILRGRVSTVDLGNLERLNKNLQSSGNVDYGAQPIVEAVNHLFHYAFEQRASDIHLEPKRDMAIVRFRIDGVLHNVYMLKRVIYSAIVSRIKVMAGMNIAEKRRPQDGRIKIIHREQEIELRVSTIATAFGEKVVLRIFDPDILLQDIQKLGFTDGDFQLFDEFIHHPYGIILVTGPTGSGKTTTLYSALNRLSTPEINITTIEDPIELIHEVFNQVAVNPRIDITFASVLRTMLRQDPDIIMVGEIRDNETVQNAIQAALTGHLVLSTLHTNDAPTAITRLIDMGGKPFLIASTLVGVMAQRLVRKICPYCKVRYAENPDTLKNILGIPVKNEKRVKLYRGKGCLECRGTGYLGRTGVFEVMKLDDEVRELTKMKASANEIRKVALKNGMTTLRKNALQKLVNGITTVEEAAKIIRGV